MSIENWQPVRFPLPAVHTQVPELYADTAVTLPTRLQRNLAALTRVLLGIAPPSPADPGLAPVPEEHPLVAAQEPVEMATSTPDPTEQALRSGDEPIAAADSQRLRSVLADLSFLDE